MKKANVKLSDLEIHTLVQLRKRGAWYIVEERQGWNMEWVNLRSTKKSKTRCQRLSYRHKLIKINTPVYEYYEPQNILDIIK